MDPKTLPIYDLEASLVEALRRDRARVVLRAPTGSGKSTQVPQILIDHGLVQGQVIVLQPRRLAARLLAARVAAERGTALGGEVGYQVRFDDRSNASTRIKFVTEGILLRRLLADPELKGVGAILFDEFHERHLYGDLSLARMLNLQESLRPDLRLVVMSATLTLEALEAYLAPCRVLTAEGRLFPVDIEYLPKGTDPARTPVWELAADAFERLAPRAEGDVLVFMPGAYEIQRTIDALRRLDAAKDFDLLPLHGELPPERQDAAVAPSARRKVVVSTNVAETSITIEGVRTVLDGGLARVPRFDPHRGIDTLLIEKISRASADQRAGRAGRVAPGRCIRLWTEQDHRGRALEETPEIRRVDLAEAVLTLRASGVDDLRAFRWFEPPEEKSLARAEQLLEDLGAVDARSRTVTPTGRRMLTFPVHPRYARMLLEAGRRHCVYPVALIAALTQGRDILVRRTGRAEREARDDSLGEHAESDFFILMRAWRYAEQAGFDVGRCQRLGVHAQAARQVQPLVDLFLRLAKQQGLPVEKGPVEDEAIQRCVLAGFADQLALRMDEGTLRCRLVHGRRGQLARESAVHHRPLFVAADVREIEGREVQVILSLATAVDPEWLRELWPDDFHEELAVRYDAAAKRVTAERQTLFRDLQLASKPADPPADEAARLLAEAVGRGELVLRKWDRAADQWIARVNVLAAACPDLGLPAFGEDDRRAVVEQLCLGAFSYKDLRDRDVLGPLKDWLSGAQRALVERLAPERVTLPSGRAVRLEYTPGQPPALAAKIQDLYGLDETPRIARGRIPLVVQILGPNFRPVQVTQDLANFWKETYPQVKQELKRKYPKHEWR